MRKIILFSTLLFCSISLTLNAQQGSDTDSDSDKVTPDRLEKKTIRKAKYDSIKIDRSFYIRMNVVFANLETKIRFETNNSIFSAQISLEKNLGYERSAFFGSITGAYRITPRSGIFALYYNVNRETSRVLDRDIVFLGDTLAKGAEINSFFKTRVLSVGYMYSILMKPNAFLGAFINIYLMDVETGLSSDLFQVDDKVKLLLPLPNIGLNGRFRLTDWLYLHGYLGVFYIKSEAFTGSVHDIKVDLDFRPLTWLGFTLGYQVYNITASFPSEEFRTIIEYNFSGPSLGFAIEF